MRGQLAYFRQLLTSLVYPEDRSSSLPLPNTTSPQAPSPELIFGSDSSSDYAGSLPTLGITAPTNDATQDEQHITVLLAEVKLKHDHRFPITAEFLRRHYFAWCWYYFFWPCQSVSLQYLDDIEMILKGTTGLDSLCNSSIPDCGR